MADVVIAILFLALPGVFVALFVILFRRATRAARLARGPSHDPQAGVPYTFLGHVTGLIERTDVPAERQRCDSDEGS